MNLYKKIGIASSIFCTLVLSACGQSGNTEASPNEDTKKEVRVVDEVYEGDFVYTLTSEQERYQEGQPIQLRAELTYIGEDEEITIGHASSPFHFPMKETTRGYDIPFSMTEPFITTTMKREEPFKESYVPSGGFGSLDPEEYKDFMKRMMAGDVPVGHYEVEGTAKFTVLQDEEAVSTARAGDVKDLDEYEMRATIEFEVE